MKCHQIGNGRMLTTSGILQPSITDPLTEVSGLIGNNNERNSNSHNSHNTCGINCEHQIQDDNHQNHNHNQNQHQPLSGVLAAVRCGYCCQPICDRYIMRVVDTSYHETCLKCTICSMHLVHSCFMRDGKLYCRLDYERYVM